MVCSKDAMFTGIRLERFRADRSRWRREKMFRSKMGYTNIRQRWRVLDMPLFCCGLLKRIINEDDEEQEDSEDRNITFQVLSKMSCKSEG